MTTPPTPSATWDKMTDGEKIAFLAVKVMGWEKRKNTNSFWFIKGVERNVDAFTGYAWHRTLHTQIRWNPLTDWNHWREVEEKIFSDETIVARLNEHIGNYAQDRWMRSDLPTRAKALYLAYQSIHD